MKNAQQDKAARFRAHHEGPDVLVLPNAWDVATAVLMEDAGFSAVGTTSAGMAALYGAPIPKMKELGVARVSVGSAIVRASLALVRAAAEELQTHGTYGFADKAIPYDEVNDLLRRRADG